MFPQIKLFKRDWLSHFQVQNSHGMNQYSPILCEVFTPRPIQKVEALGKMGLTKFRTKTHLSVMTCVHDTELPDFYRGLLQ